MLCRTTLSESSKWTCTRNIIYNCYHSCLTLKLCSDEIFSYFEILAGPVVWHRWEFETSQFQAMDKCMEAKLQTSVTWELLGGVTGAQCKFIPESINAYWFIKGLLCARHKRNPGTEIFLLYLYASMLFAMETQLPVDPLSICFCGKDGSGR